jgi:hypothetical protein
MLIVTQKIGSRREFSIYDAKKQLFWDTEDTKINNSFLNKMIRFETVLTAHAIFSWAK